MKARVFFQINRIWTFHPKYWSTLQDTNFTIIIRYSANDLLLMIMDVFISKQCVLKANGAFWNFPREILIQYQQWQTVIKFIHQDQINLWMNAFLFKTNLLLIFMPVTNDLFSSQIMCDMIILLTKSQHHKYLV